VFEYLGTFDFALSPEEMWDALEHTERFEAWWGWLREFRLEGNRLAPGSVLHGLVSPPVPYQMKVQVFIDEAVRPSLVEATVRGDLRGTARLQLRAEGPGARVEARWTVEMMQRPMRVAARVAHPLLRWGHDRVVEATVAGFRSHVERR
jgi:uncharacterized protein YndB with AHSA1/START domain